MIGRMLGVVFGGAVALAGLAVILVGLALTILAFPSGAVLGLPVAIVGGVIGGAAASSSARQQAMTDTVLERACARCGGPMEGKRPHAISCSRACKNALAELRRRERDPGRDQRRYLQEAERRREYARAYHVANPHVSKAARAKRKAALRGDSAGVFTSRDWQRLVRRFDGRCAYCHRRARLQVEHVVPLSRGGLHRIGNIVPACAACNYEKHSSTVTEWRMRRLRRGGDSNLSPSGKS